jgi:hypothetical protein
MLINTAPIEITTMPLTTILPAPHLDIEIKGDREILLSGQHSDASPDRVLPAACDCARMLHRTTLIGETAFA